MTDIIGIWILIDRFSMIEGWTLPELALIYGTIHSGFSIGEATARSFEKFSLLVKGGGFDRVLLRPLPTIFQIATNHIQLLKIGRLAQGLFILIWGFIKLNFNFFSIQTAVIVLSIIGTTCLFYGLFIIQATFAFWTTETIELMHMTTYGGRETGQYPITIFPTPFRLFFTCIIPLACVAYYPIAILLQHEDFPFWLAALTPLAGCIFLFVSCKFWEIGVRHYHSTGS